MRKFLAVATSIWLIGATFADDINEEYPENTANEIKKWEYKCLGTNRNNAYYKWKKIGNNFENAFNTLGREGWEMIVFTINGSASHGDVCFKRKNSGSAEEQCSVGLLPNL